MNSIAFLLVTLSLTVSLALGDSVSQTCNNDGCQMIKTYSDGRENEYYSLDSTDDNFGSDSNADLSYVSVAQSDQQGDEEDDSGISSIQGYPSDESAVGIYYDELVQQSADEQPDGNFSPLSGGASNSDAYTDYGYANQEGQVQPQQQQQSEQGSDVGYSQIQQVSGGYSSGGGSVYDSDSNTDYSYEYTNQAPQVQQQSQQQQVGQQTNGGYSTGGSVYGGASGSGGYGLGGLLRLPSQVVGNILGRGGLLGNIQGGLNYGGGLVGL